MHQQQQQKQRSMQLKSLLSFAVSLQQTYRHRRWWQSSLLMTSMRQQMMLCRPFASSSHLRRPPYQLRVCHRLQPMKSVVCSTAAEHTHDHDHDHNEQNERSNCCHSRCVVCCAFSKRIQKIQRAKNTNKYLEL